MPRFSPVHPFPSSLAGCVPVWPHPPRQKPSWAEVKGARSNRRIPSCTSQPAAALTPLGTLRAVPWSRRECDYLDPRVTVWNRGSAALQHMLSIAGDSDHVWAGHVRSACTCSSTSSEAPALVCQLGMITAPTSSVCPAGGSLMHVKCFLTQSVCKHLFLEWRIKTEVRHHCLSVRDETIYIELD